jgi:hypothetical protein
MDFFTVEVLTWKEVLSMALRPTELDENGSNGAGG